MQYYYIKLIIICNNKLYNIKNLVDLVKLNTNRNHTLILKEKLNEGVKMDLTEKTKSSKIVFNGKIIDVLLDTVELPNNKTATREVVKHSGGVVVAALTDDNNFLFVKQYRYPYKEVLLELPAGKLEKGQLPLENGKRELLEETGAIGHSFISLGQLYPSPGYCGEIIHLYFCRVKSIQEPCPDEDEFLEVIEIPLNKAVKMVMENRIADAKTQVAILKVNNLIKENF